MVKPILTIQEAIAISSYRAQRGMLPRLIIENLIKDGFGAHQIGIIMRWSKLSKGMNVW